MLGQGCSLLRKPALPEGDVLQTVRMAVVLPAGLPAASCIHSGPNTSGIFSGKAEHRLFRGQKSPNLQQTGPRVSFPRPSPCPCLQVSVLLLQNDILQGIPSKLSS